MAVTGLALDQDAHAKQARRIPLEYQRKMLEKPALHRRYQDNIKIREMPKGEALADALGYLFTGTFTQEGSGNIYAWLATDENVEFIEACISGEKYRPGGEGAKVPDYAAVQMMIKEMDAADVTQLLLLEQRGHNNDGEPRPHVIKLLLGRVQRDMGKKTPKPKLSEAELADLVSAD